MEFTHANKRAPFRKLAELMGLLRLIVSEQLAEYRTSLRTQSSFGIVGMSPAVISWRPQLWSRVGERIAAKMLILSGQKRALLQDAIFSATIERYE